MGSLTARKLTANEVEEILSNKLSWLLTAANPWQIILFGSAATGEMTEASDVDLILVFDSDEDLKLAKEAIYKSRPKDDWPHDLLFHTRQSLQIANEKGGGASWLALREGKILYTKEKA